MERYNAAYRAGTAAQSAEFDAGLRAYMLKVYNYMASGVLLTGIIAMIVGTNESLMATIYGGGLRWIVALAPLAFIMVMSLGAHKMKSSTLQAIFWAFAAVMGLSMASIFAVYSAESIARTFFITAASFGALSLYGYTTKKSLSGMGTFLFMGVIGLLIAGVVNIFLGSPLLAFIFNVGGVLIFAGLTAYDTQRIKESYFMSASGEAMAKGAIMGAVNLYLDFVNLFMFLLSFLGDRE